MANPPTLVVISGPPGTGKTTLAHALAGRVGCPAICRDEIKEGMAHAVPGFVAGPGDALTVRTLPTFFGVLGLLLRAGVTTVAEAAFQDRVWRSGLQPLERIARIRLVQCTVDADVALSRRLRRREADPVRRAHADPKSHADVHSAFDRVSMNSPSLTVDTTDGYDPGIEAIVGFINGQYLHRVSRRGIPGLTNAHCGYIPKHPLHRRHSMAVLQALLYIAAVALLVIGALPTRRARRLSLPLLGAACALLAYSLTSIAQVVNL